QHLVAPSFTQNLHPSRPNGHHQAAPSPSIHSAAPTAIRNFSKHLQNATQQAALAEHPSKP
ncbi:MAG: hypothetical protein ACK6A8_19280, partial [Planctomycetota bacterium]